MESHSSSGKFSFTNLFDFIVHCVTFSQYTSCVLVDFFPIILLIIKKKIMLSKI